MRCALALSCGEVLTRPPRAPQITVLNKSKILAAAGENSDRVAFTEYVKSNLALHKYRSDVALSTAATAAWIRTTVRAIWLRAAVARPPRSVCAPVPSLQLASYLRKRPYQVNLLLGGYDEDEGSSLYYIDYMGTKQKMGYAAHGHCSNFILSVMDRHWKVRGPLSPCTHTHTHRRSDDSSCL